MLGRNEDYSNDAISDLIYVELQLKPENKKKQIKVI